MDVDWVLSRFFVESSFHAIPALGTSGSDHQPVFTGSFTIRTPVRSIHFFMAKLQSDFRLYITFCGDITLCYYYALFGERGSALKSIKGVL